MKSESQPPRENIEAPNARGETNINADDAKPDMSLAPSVPCLPPTHAHYKIACEVEKDWWDKSKPFVEIAGAVLLAIYTAYTIKMYCVNKQAADAATSASVTTREALTSTQRAFVSYGGGGSATKNIVENKLVSLTVTLPWENEGVTPTRNASSRVNWKAIPNGLPQGFNFPDEGSVEYRQFMIAPKGIGNATMEIPVVYLDAVRQKKLRAFVWGWITYHDIFDRTPTRLSEFCDEIINVKSSDKDIYNPVTNITWELTLCTVPHNCSDEECQDYQDKIKGR